LRGFSSFARAPELLSSTESPFSGPFVHQPGHYKSRQRVSRVCAAQFPGRDTKRHQRLPCVSSRSLVFVGVHADAPKSPTRQSRYGDGAPLWRRRAGKPVPPCGARKLARGKACATGRFGRGRRWAHRPRPQGCFTAENAEGSRRFHCAILWSGQGAEDIGGRGSSVCGSRTRGETPRLQLHLCSSLFICGKSLGWVYLRFHRTQVADAPKPLWRRRAGKPVPAMATARWKACATMRGAQTCTLESVCHHAGRANLHAGKSVAQGGSAGGDAGHTGPAHRGV